MFSVSQLVSFLSFFWLSSPCLCASVLKPIRSLAFGSGRRLFCEICGYSFRPLLFRPTGGLRNLRIQPFPPFPFEILLCVSASLWRLFVFWFRGSGVPGFRPEADLSSFRQSDYYCKATGSDKEIITVKLPRAPGGRRDDDGDSSRNKRPYYRTAGRRGGALHFRTVKLNRRIIRADRMKVKGCKSMCYSFSCP